MYNRHSYNLKLFIRLIAILVVECFVVTSIAPDYEEITAILRNDSSDEIIRSFAKVPSPLKAKAGSRQLESAFNPEAPFY